MNIPCDILIIGTGSLATNISLCLSTQNTHRNIRIMHVGRNEEKLAAMTRIMNLRADVNKRYSRFSYKTIDFNDEKTLINLFKYTNPNIILLCSSLQTPWIKKTTSWEKLVHKHGFGITLPLQVNVALKVGSALQKSHVSSLFINACYPDVTNYILKQYGIDVFSGVGNVNIISAYLANQLNLKKIKVIAHHYHLSKFNSSTSAKKNFYIIENNKLHALEHKILNPLFAIKGDAINQITGSLSAKLLLKILSGKKFSTNLPGPLGLPGGYPVEIQDYEIKLNLPKTISTENIIRNNENWTADEGIIITQTGMIYFPKETQNTMKHCDFSFTKGFHISEITSVSDEIQEYQQQYLSR